MKTRLLTIIGILSGGFTGFVFAEHVDLFAGISTMDGKVVTSFELGDQIMIKHYVKGETYDQRNYQVTIQSEDHAENKQIIDRFTLAILPEQEQSGTTFYTPPNSGKYTLQVKFVEINANISAFNQNSNFVVVDNFSKAYENHHCAVSLSPVIKPNYSSIVCVTDDTQNKLILRGWIEIEN